MYRCLSIRGFMKRLAIFACAMFFGCAVQTNSLPEPQGEYKWRRSTTDVDWVSESELRHEFIVATNTCKIEALKIPVPSPSCTQPPRKDCTGLSGFARGFCLGYTPQRQCDYSATNTARRAQVEIYESCMILRGWEKVWVPWDNTTIQRDDRQP